MPLPTRRAAGKPAKVAIVACMHTFLRWLNAIARDHAPYAPRSSPRYDS